MMPNFERLTQVEVPSGSDPWSDRARRKLPLIRPSQTEVFSDQTKVRSKLSLIRPSQTKRPCDQTIIRPLSRRLCDHGPVQTQTIVQTIVRSKSLLIGLFCTQKLLLIRLSCAQNHLTARIFVIIYSFHTKWCLHYYIHLKKRLF